MKCRLFCICAVLVAVASFGAYSAQSGPKGKMQPKAAGKAASRMTQVRVAPNATPNVNAQPGANAAVGSQIAPMPSGTGAGPNATMQPSTAAPVGSGPGVIAQGTNTSGMAIAVEGDSVYVVQGGMLYKFPKGDVTCNGTAFPPPCPPGAGPACPAACALCSGMTLSRDLRRRSP